MGCKLERAESRRLAGIAEQELPVVRQARGSYIENWNGSGSAAKDFRDDEDHDGADDPAAENHVEDRIADGGDGKDGGKSHGRWGLIANG